MPTSDTVAVVVVTFNSAELIAGLLASLDGGLRGPDWHLIFADNASLDGTVDAIRRLAPDATVVEMGRNAGYAAGINAAVAAAPPHSAILALNPDVRLGEGCVEELLRALHAPGTGIAVPKLLDGDGDLIESMRREPALRRAFADAFIGAGRAGRIGTLGEMVTDPALYAAETSTDWAEGSTHLISADCWEECGPWDESYFLYSEETEFDLRARDAGYLTRFVPTAQAVHLEGDSASSPALWALLVTNRVRLYRRRNGVVRGAAFWLATVLREGSRAVLGKPTSRAATRALVSHRTFRAAPGPELLSRLG